MKKILLLFLPLLACNSKDAQESPVVFAELDKAKTLQTIAFGSCNKEYQRQEMWPYIIAEDPDLWIWLGDNIYADTEDMALMEQKYDQQKAHSEYRDLLKHSPVVGIWDDHDYGINDGGKEFSKKKESKALMLNFLDVPQEAEVRIRQHGTYQSFLLGPEGKQVKIILLDTRYFRDGLEPDLDSEHRYKPNLTGDILGDEQWQWLEDEITNSPAQVHIIGSSIQIIPEEHFFEKWSNFPTARQRFIDLMELQRPPNLILLSGDRHIAEFSKLDSLDDGFQIYEATSSGLTHAWTNPDNVMEANQHRIGSVVNARNYGVLHIDWTASTPKLTVEVKGLNRFLFFREELVY